MVYDFRVLLAGAIYGVWAVATLLHFFPRFRDHIRALDFLTIVPEWRFFGSNPGRSDFYLLYRDRLATQEFTDWIEIPLNAPRPWHAFVFNSRRRPAKALMDLVIHLSRETSNTQIPILGTIPYLAILQFVSAHPATELSTHRQFLLLHSSPERGDAEPELLFSSDVHALDFNSRS